jgi:hypothetical protein
MDWSPGFGVFGSGISGVMFDQPSFDIRRDPSIQAPVSTL